MRTKITINELYDGIKDYYGLYDLNNLEDNKKFMKEEINSFKEPVVACNTSYSVSFDTEALYIEFFDDLIIIPFINGEQILNDLEQVHIIYVPIDLQLPIINDIFGIKIVQKKLKSR